MHLMIAAPEAGRQWGGIGTYLAQFLGGLGPSHEVTILSSAGSSPSVDRARVVPIADGKDIMRTYANFQLALRRRLPRILRDHRPDLFLVHHAQMPDLLCRRRSGYPPFVTIVHTTARGQAAAIQRSRRDANILDASEKAILAASSLLVPAEVYYWHRVRNAVFVSAAVHEEVQEISTSHLATSAIVPNGIEPVPLSGLQDMPFEAARREDGRIVYSGRLLGSKGLATLFRALRRLPRDRWSVDLAGAGDMSAWTRFARSLGLPDERVRFLGSLSRDALLRRLRAASIFVLPSYYESCPFSLIEAMALGIPCVATSIPALGAMIADGETGLLVPPGNPEALATALSRLLADPELGARIGEAGRRVASERFTAARMREGTLGAFERILAAA